MNTRPCTSCSAPIVDLPTSKGKLMPLNRSFFIPLMDAATFARTPAPMYSHVIHNAFVHWATCPNADQHRRPKA